MSGDKPIETLEDLREELARFAPDRREAAIADMLSEGIIDEIDADILRGKHSSN